MTWLARLAIVLLLAHGCAWSQTPVGFHWVNFKQEPAVAGRIAELLQHEEYSAIREIGIVSDSALVLTTYRDDDLDPRGDRWDVYAISMRAAKSRKLLSGYDIHWIWLKFLPDRDAELGIKYLDCYGCEPAVLFTSVYYEAKSGWRVRWRSQKPDGLPGVQLLIGDAGEPYSDEDVDQVWAVMETSPLGHASVGTWYHSQNPKTGKVTSVTEKFLVDSATNAEKSLTLHGPEATAWQRTLCTATGAVPGFRDGQDSTSCKRLLRRKAASTEEH